MKNNKGLIIAIICVVTAMVGIITAMVLTGIFSKDKEEKDGKTSATKVTQQSDETTVLPAATRPKSKKPDSVVATVYSSYSDKSAAELAEFHKFGFNTVIFELTAENAETVLPLLESAKTAQLYFGIKTDISENSAFITAFIEKNNVDFVIVSGIDEASSDYGKTVSDICKSIKTIDAATEIGVEPTNIQIANESLTALIGKCVDFVYVAQKTNDKSGMESFAKAQITWSENGSPVWLCHNLTGLSSFDTAKATEFIALISNSANISMCKGIAFTPFKDISSASGAAADSLLEYIKTRQTYLLDKELEITSHKSTTFTVEQSTVTFRGTSSPAYDLLCNGQKLKVAKTGDFSVDCELNPGENKITFEHKGKSYVYTVTYKIKLLKSVSPSTDSTVPGGMEVNVTALALKGAKVTVTFNGKTVEMTELGGIFDEESDTLDTESDFSDFTATLKMPAATTSAQKLGKFTVKATYGSLSETLSGGNITVKAKAAPPPAPPTPPATTTTEKPTENVTSESTTGSGVNATEPSTKDPENTGSITTSGNSGDKLERYYYTQNYGYGTARICEIIDDYVEVYPGYTSATYSVPDCSPLPKTTVDYVVDEAIFDETDTYYILASGVKVPELHEERLDSGVNGTIKHVKITNGYVMPKNSIRVVSTTCNDDKTVIVLDMNRPVAFNAKLTGQTYGQYAPDRYVTVSSLNCKGLEFVFSDTYDASGSNAFMNSVIKSSKWDSDRDNSTVTLSLTLTNSGKFYGYHYEYGKDGMLTITISHKPKSLKDAVIMLDPGHGGIDPGAACAVKVTGFNNEKDINLSIAATVKELLEAEGATVIMTRNGDDWRSYTQRNNAVRDRDPDMFISIHCDSSSTASATGTSAYYYRAYSQPLAKAVHDRLVSAYKTEIYKDNTEIKIDRGTNFYAFRVARVEECPAILIEYGFVSNIEECQTLQNAETREILAQATVDGIKDYLAKS